MLVRSLLAVALLAAAACSGDDDTSTPSTTTTSTTPSSTTVVEDTSTTTSTTAPTTSTIDPDQQIQTFDDDCEGWGPPPAEGQAQLTFVRDGRLYGADLDGSVAMCLTDDAPGEPFAWGPAADKAIDGALVVTGTGSTAYQGAPLTASFTRPTGKSVIAVTDDGRILKTNTESGEVVDVSFLDRHDDVTYYPSGTHIITGGEHADGTSGIWLATNVGAEPQLLASSPDTTFSHLSVAEDGGSLVFVADHDGERHVHRARLAADELTTGTDEQDAETLATTDRDVLALAAGPFGEVAALTGACGATTSFAAPDHPRIEAAVPDGSWPIAWHPDGTSLLVGHDVEGCPGADEPFDVTLVSAIEDVDPVLLVSAVTAAALRAPVGEPPPPPSDNFSGFV